MKHLLSLIAIVLLGSLYGCDGDTTNVNAAQPDNYFSQQATLQGTIFDGVTGAKITDTSLRVTLVQGASYRNASVRTGSQTFAGDFSLSNIPISLNDQTEYRLVVTANGYQEFESTIAFDALGGDTLDSNYNYVGNVQLYPVGVGANDVAVNVSFNGEAVPGATVQLTRSALSVIGTVSGTGAFLASNRTSGYLGNLNATTDSNGIATFPSTSLVLGGTYGVRVLPVTYKGIPLAQVSGSSISVGTSIILQAVQMSDLVPGTSNGLYIANRSNRDTNMVTSSGVLTIEFSRAVSLVDETTILATLGGGVVTAALDNTNSPDSTTTATLSPDGLTLTLSPNFATAPVAFNGSNGTTADDALTITYSNVLVRLTDTNDSGAIYSVFGTLVGVSGLTPSGSVLVTPNF